MLTKYHSLIYFIVITYHFYRTNAAMTMKQLEQSLAMFRKTCSEKNNIDPALVDGLHRGEWPDDNKDLKCFALCIAQTSGTLTKKNELSEQKVKKQILTQLPVNLRELALGALEACKDIQKGYKDPCDRMYYSTKCLYDYSPDNFLYP
ncbi:general odorant-binding protein 72-like [Contarinia nasturtii]|uniref:general odorant-binding protein 72-like n=1 Tax=Contarinia nasturtii TaxID=265458 RepID=UPI0012D42147|nr:general odorant-binding protein 72-like [Contarinia nasturtii]